MSVCKFKWVASNKAKEGEDRGNGELALGLRNNAWNKVMRVRADEIQATVHDLVQNTLFHYQRKKSMCVGIYEDCGCGTRSRESVIALVFLCEARVLFEL